MNILRSIMAQSFEQPTLACFAAALEVISGSVTGAGAVFTAWTVNAGNSLAIRSAPLTSNVWLLEKWAFNDTAAGVLRVRSPRLHDNVQGIRSRIVNNDTEPLLSGLAAFGWRQKLVPQDILIAEQTGSAANIDTGHLLVYYENLPGISARFIDNATLIANGVNRIGQEVSITTTAASGAYTGQVAINAVNDNFKANTDYALLGAMVDTRVGTVRIQGADVGNLGIGIPGEPTQRHLMSNYFQRLSQVYNLPLIPVFNSANKTAILIDATGHTAAVTSVVTLYMVELAAKTGSSSGGQYGV
ncbi:MAG TPA: hypothetical protein VNZ03_14895 [Terriglobales bacterium]|jgi:hypothetical protein|nr:hypothetical protein [Terriglobales bacterium]